MEIKKYKFPHHDDSRGARVAIEEMKDIPFQVKRMYYMYGVKEGVERGFHAHKKLEQILICIHGSCRIKLDDGYEKAEVLLDNPGEGLYIGSNLFHVMDKFSSNAVLLVLASELYDESDYIRDYDEFLEYVRKCKG